MCMINADIQGAQKCFDSVEISIQIEYFLPGISWVRNITIDHQHDKNDILLRPISLIVMF